MSPLIIYGLITVISALILFVMAIFGAETDVDADVDVDIDVDADVDLDAGGMEVGEFGGPSKLSLKLIFFFLIGFGVLGYISSYLNWTGHHVIWALAGGAVFWYIGYAVLKLLYKQQSNSQIGALSFVGKKATVTVVIPQAGVGEISAGGGDEGPGMHLAARAKDPEKEYKKGDVVTVRSVAGGTATVE